MYILGINISHHSSACLLKDGEIIFYIENDRLTRKKLFGYQESYDSQESHLQSFDESKNTFFPQLNILKKHTNFVDYVIFSSYGQENMDGKIIKKIGEELDVNGITYNTKLFYHENHHLYHAASAFYGSGFEDSVALIMDGGGSYEIEFYNKYLKNTYNYPFRESESIYKCSYKNGFSPVFKHYSLFDKEDNHEEIFITNTEKSYKEIFTHSISCGDHFSLLSNLFNVGDNGAGKIMGLASFGSDHPQELLLHEDLFYELNGEYVSKSNPYQFVRKLMEHLKIDENVMIEDLNFYDKQFDNCATIAKRIQDETKKHTIRLIQKSIDLTGSKNIVLSGGYFLNCVNNYQYLNHFPDINFYIDPISYDGGTAIGAAKWFWHGLTGDKTIRKLNTLYLG